MEGPIIRPRAYPLFVMALLSGCQSLYDYRPVPVLVLDAETRKPIPDATVRFSYPMTHANFAPCDSVGRTGSDGIARLRAAPCGDHDLLMEAKTKGYMTFAQDISDDTVRNIKRRGWFEKGERPPVFVAEMYAEPAFFVDLVVPNTHRGLVKAVVEFKDEIPCPAGQRGFSFEVDVAGKVQVAVPSLLRRYPPTYHARFADGTPLSEELDTTKVGFRWVKREGNEEIFVVGNQFDYDHYRRVLMQRAASSNASAVDGGKASHKGGRKLSPTDER